MHIETAAFRMKRDDEILSRLHRVKQRTLASPPPLGPELISFFKQSIQKRHAKFGAIADCWQQHIPARLLEHCALESFHQGTLKIVVDSSSHLYELKQLLLASVQKKMLIACKATGLRKITLKQGRWYDGDGADRKLRF